ncbi:MAG: helix-turn-helix domain-containing protein [Woeseiaceae bacterium]|nr:helix-turn-helix domain-containing protein [Woeseiaceae bacterium]NIP20153.1 helix-turn-helix domain-containing protein [Woeseiaceae bacterium]NIS88949.1 helix-turn-helix domain-containing protein [Woeseiaceae bacterium]
MLNEPTTISSAARLIGETLQQDFGIDPEPVYRQCRIDTSKFHKPGSRILFSKMNKLWKLAVEASGDPGFGLKVGARVVPGDFYVLGHAWLASETLLGAFRRLARFIRILSTVGSKIEIRRQGDKYALIENFANRIVQPQQAALDAGYMALLQMCNFVSVPPIRPCRVVLPRPADENPVDYAAAFGCPVEFDDIEIWEFSAADVEAQLTGSIPDVADAVESIAEDYMSSLEEGAVVHEVRQMLIQLLPSGRSDQETIARRLYRSRSTLQRQLGSEGTSYRQILESTRQSLAKKYLQSHDYSQAEIAFMLGFTDQSNFARAFKRWTGVSPGEFQKAA